MLGWEWWACPSVRCSLKFQEVVSHIPSNKIVEWHHELKKLLQRSFSVIRNYNLHHLESLFVHLNSHSDFFYLFISYSSPWPRALYHIAERCHPYSLYQKLVNIFWKILKFPKIKLRPLPDKKNQKRVQKFNKNIYKLLNWVEMIVI